MKIYFLALFLMGSLLSFHSSLRAGPFEDFVEALDHYSSTQVDHHLLISIRNSAESILNFDYRLGYPEKDLDPKTVLIVNTYLSLWQALDKHFKYVRLTQFSLQDITLKQELDTLLHTLKNSLPQRDNVGTAQSLEPKIHEMNSRIADYVSQLKRLTRNREIQLGSQIHQVLKMIRKNPDFLSADLEERVCSLQDDIEKEESILRSKKDEIEAAITKLNSILDETEQAQTEFADLEKKYSQSLRKIQTLERQISSLQSECKKFEAERASEKERANQTFQNHLQKLIDEHTVSSGQSQTIDVLGLEDDNVISSSELREKIKNTLRSMLNEVYLLSPARMLTQEYLQRNPIVPQIEIYGEVIRAENHGSIWSKSTTLVSLIVYVRLSTSLAQTYDQEIFRNFVINPKGALDLKQNQEQLQTLKAFVNQRIETLLPKTLQAHFNHLETLKKTYAYRSPSAPPFETLGSLPENQSQLPFSEVPLVQAQFASPLSEIQALELTPDLIRAVPVILQKKEVTPQSEQKAK